MRKTHEILFSYLKEKNRKNRVGEAGHQLRALAAPAGPRFSPYLHQVAHHHLSPQLHAGFWPLLALHTWTVHIDR